MEFVLSEICQQVMAARGAERPIYIRGGGTKGFYGEPVSGGVVPDTAVLDMSAYHGIINYQPSELVVTARAGTLLSDLESTLDEQDQMLAFEPPRFGSASTIGGCIASGLAGPRRMAAGSVRDFVLGARLLDSTGMALNFGGEVMKNVAGYDVSRLLAGSMGILGPLLEVSIKVVPKPPRERTQVLDVDESQALELFNQWRGQPIAMSASAWLRDDDGAGRLFIRLSGTDPAVQSAIRRVGGEPLPEPQGHAFWASLRDQTHSFFDARPLWRVAVPPHTRALQQGSTLIEWNGGQRWLSQVQSPEALRSAVAAQGGHATLYRYDSKPADVPVFHPLDDSLKNINRRMKQELDPFGIFNPKRLFPDF